MKGGTLETTIDHFVLIDLLYNNGTKSLTDQYKCDCLYKLINNYGQIDTANLPNQSNDDHNAMSEMKASLVASNTNIYTLREAKKNQQQFQNNIPKRKNLSYSKDHTRPKLITNLP